MGDVKLRENTCALCAVIGLGREGGCMEDMYTELGWILKGGTRLCHGRGANLGCTNDGGGCIPLPQASYSTR